MATPLSQKIASHIREIGHPITFANFMEMALYDSEYGYYTTGSSPGQSGRPGFPIGMAGGDFYTAPCVSPLLAQILVRQLQEIDGRLGHPSDFTLLEMGPGEGRLIKDILDEIKKVDSDLYARLSIILIERSPFLQTVQKQAVEGHSHINKKVTWVSHLNNLKDESLVGVFLSNELVDAFPVHRVRMEPEGLKEIYVDLVDGQFVEYLDEPSTDDLLKVLKACESTLPVGMTTEINVNAVEWMQEVVRVLHAGVVLTIDYGHTSQDYFSPQRNEGTLMCYYRHTVTTNPYERIGEQDMTAHVNFSNLAQVGEKTGLTLTGFTNLIHFLMSLGIDEIISGYDQESPEVKGAIELLRPQGMGTTFKVLIQHKGVEISTLQALRHRPFFDGVLIPVGCGT
ncbi:class I SAM-dependent methyltransferase [Candidatus Nitronereus thalassa]|uniref:SAM-dependent methyltransferase n=1 Tax=Candidatus Nitronereus thalassa TaxID=3020898 RepID=A0ABU3K5H1_9BACT|nr:SAM-dependent methyltransferase [Candidatus Nitronereus thalassa]MDT7041640.1 SAM-dependent methyltransferase [Candidatus Nitronereus thalassa]